MDAFLAADGQHDQQRCAVKTFFSCEENRFYQFQNEVRIYDKFQGCSFIPYYYGAFAGMTFTGPAGFLVTELMERTFNSFDEMSGDEK